MQVLAVVGVSVALAMLIALILLARGERSVPAPVRGRGRARHVSRLAGIAAGAVAGWTVADLGRLGEGRLLAGPAFGLCALGGVLLGELLARRPGGAVRAAGLRVRRIRDFVPARGGVAAALTTGSLVMLAITTSLTADPTGDAADRSLTIDCGAERYTASPYPGLFYSRPALAALAVGLVATLFVLRRIARRPWPVDESEGQAESALRRRSAEATLAGYGILVVTMFIGFVTFVAGPLANLGCPGVLSYKVGAAALGCSALLGLLCFVMYLVRLVAPPSWSRA